jgi:outer membrane lipoprotein-sorting protein
MISGRAIRFALIASALGFAVIAARASGQSAQNASASQSPAAADQILAEVIKHNEQRDAQLHSYSSVRTYVVKDQSGAIKASKTVRMLYFAPNTKQFESITEDGSAVVRGLVFDRLMETEAATAGGHERRDTSITPANYTFRLAGREDVAAHHCYVVEVLPKREDKYLFRGQIWVDSADFAVVRIAGSPAKRPSFWITRADFVRQFEKVGDFWLPSRDETSVDVRFYGTKLLSIEHRIGSVNGVTGTPELLHSSLNAKVAALR